MKKESILSYLSNVKSKYQNEADENSDVDILVEATPEFANRYGFGAFKRIKEIQSEISNALGLPVYLADSTGMGKTGKKFIIDRAIYI